MGANAYYKKYVEKLVNANPTDIVLTRIIKEPDGYEGSIEYPVQISLTVTFYTKKGYRTIIQEKGAVISGMTSTVNKILTKGDADMHEGDTFEHGGRKYRVGLVSTYLGICTQAEVEVVG
jgi:hypothetical protein